MTIIKDKDLGDIRLRTVSRSKRYTIRVKAGSVSATMPTSGSILAVLELIDANRPRLIEALEQIPVQGRWLDDTTKLQTNTFRLHIFRTKRTRFYMNLKDGILHIACPEETDFNDPSVQATLRQLLEKALRHEAKRILPDRLHALARQHGFTYTSVKINNSKGRWGSCGIRGGINLSLSLMLLPDHLIDYVILHELCHTREMNHSTRFWELMNNVTANQAQLFRKELKSYHPI